MPLTVLASVSLLALVVTGRPIMTPDPRFVEASGEVHNAVQAIIESRLGPSANKPLGESDDAPLHENQIYSQVTNFQLHLSSSKSQTEVLAELASEEVKLIIPLDDLTRDSAIVTTSEEKTLLDALESLDDLDGVTNLPLSTGLDEIVEGEYDVLEIEDVDGLTPEQVSELNPNQDEARGSWWMTLLDETKRPILVSAACATAVVLMFLCTVTALYAIDFIKASLFNSRDLYDLLPGVEKGELGAPQGKVGYEEKKLILDTPEKAKEEDTFDEKRDIETGNAPLPAPPSDETPLPPPPYYPEVEAGDADDSFEDAPEVEHDDPELLPLPEHNNQQPPSASPRRSMNRERTSTNPPPSWSIRASESQTLSIPGAYTFDPLPLPFSEVMTETGEVTRRPYSDRNPEIDIALAMQLRPGQGEGADAAWLVRFLMGIFGWVTVVVSGNGR
ncbi:hypothetical protein BJ322DRAFT_254418 [Thelephora terrestris]|uniref:Uncharacterized protein n=2 Tax=Thelephora terrestris TaxID=56493 RepID=A0A9P6H7H3_9AGAM|nr:hypothetical protein BJ322DRAFT_254418 [Thelephora terrestris]